MNASATLQRAWSESKGQRKRRRVIRKTLKAFGFTRTFGARYGGWVTIGVIAFLVLALSMIPPLVFPRVSPLVSPLIPSWLKELLEDFPSGFTKDLRALIIGLGALYLGFQQWRASRSEVSLDAFWRRLASTNDKLDEWPEVRQFAGPWEEDGRENKQTYRRRMYVYLELDSLEYTVGKYRIGYMTSEDAYRGLNTFRQRCLASPRFCDLVLESVRNYAYDRETRLVVRHTYEWRKDPAQWNRDKGLPVDEEPIWELEAQGA